MADPTYTPRPELNVLVEEFSLAGNAAGLVGMSIMPLFNTVRSTGIFPKINAKALLQRADSTRGPRGGYNRVGMEFDKDSFACIETGLEGIVDESIAVLYQDYIDAEMAITRKVLYDQAIDQEFRIRDVVEGQSATNVATPWSTSATCKPRDDIADASQTMKNAIGRRPNSLQLTFKKFQEVMECAQFLDITKFTTNPYQLGLDAQISLVSTFLQVPNLFISDSVADDADEGQTVDASGIWTDTKGFLFVGGGALGQDPSFGYTMNYTEDGLVGTESYRDEIIRADIIRVRHYRDEKVALGDAGFSLGNL